MEKYAENYVILENHANEILKMRSLIKEIFNKMELNFGRSRFLYKKHYYPVNIIFFQGNSKLGFFDSNFFRIGINKHILGNSSLLTEVLQHEIAHFITHIDYPNISTPHGYEFHKTCQSFGFSDEVSKAATHLESIENDKKNNKKLIKKFEKLNALSTSDNPYEAELALAKAREIQSQILFKDTDSEFVVLPLFSEKRASTTMQAIQSILSEYSLFSIINQGTNYSTLEVLGTSENCELAEYLTNYLKRTFIELYKKAQRTKGLRGIREKNSFILGVTSGIKKKIQKVEINPSDSNELIKAEKQLLVHAEIFYNKLSSRKSGSIIDRRAKNIGIKAGQSVQIKEGIKEPKRTRLISFFR